MAHIELKNIKKSFGMVDVIKGVDLEVHSGEFMVFVGPSGCGKSTLLRLMAGLEDITSGEMTFDGTLVNALAPSKRGIAMVFQSYALARVRFRGRGLLLMAILAVSMFPQIAVLAGLIELIKFLGLFNTPWAMIVSYTIFTLPFTVWVLTTFMRDLPLEIEEAAIVDGASPWVIITKVFLPLLWPALVTTGLLAFIGAWNEFLFALTFTLSEAQRTTPVAIAMLSGASVQEIPWGPIMAASVIVTVPLVILVLNFQRKIVAGLTAGGVKG